MSEVTIVGIDLAKRVFTCTARSLMDPSLSAKSFHGFSCLHSLPSTRDA